MTTPSVPAICFDRLTSRRGDPAIGGDGARMRAQCRHLATVVTISGDVDAANAGHVQDFATRMVLVRNAVILDLGGVDFFAARGISVLIAVDDACRTADVPWALVPSLVVSRVLQLTDLDTTVPRSCDPIDTGSVSDSNTAWGTLTATLWSVTSAADEVRDPRRRTLTETP